MNKLFSFLFLFTFFTFPAFAGYETSPEWLTMVHYRPSGNDYVSTFDSVNFFLSENGKESPLEELNATIDLFENSTDNEKKCLFPARYKRLKTAGLITKAYPKCEALEQFYTDLRPAGVTLLFTDAYMNNPSSLFGHTLLRIDTARKGTQLLAHGVNYGAFVTEEDNGALFALKGLLGGYFGGFTVKPYYDITNMYNNLENRDIWEYNFDFTQDELDIFVAHLWEVGHAQSRYFFFTRNCAYVLLETMDAVRPSLKLADDFPLQAIPLDTLKAVNSRPGFVKSINYRPSRQAKIRHRYKNMNPAQQKQYLKNIKEHNFDVAGLPESEQADVLETAYQYVQYQYVAQKLELQDYRTQSFEALTARNKIKKQAVIPELQMGNSPLETHESMRFTAGGGFRNGEAFQEISYRPAYHSLTDDNHGFLRGAEINFLNTTLRHYDDQNKTVLQRLDLVGIKSFSPIDEMFSPMSYVINADIAREFNPETEDEGYAFNLKVGGGAVYAFSDEVWGYAMGNSYVSYGGFLPHNQWIGAGFGGGIYADFDSWRLLAEAEKVFASSKFADKIKYRVEASYTLSRNNALAFEYLLDVNHGKNIDEGSLSWRHYF